SLYFLFLFFFSDPASTAFYTLSLHDALPISLRVSYETETVFVLALAKLTEDGRNARRIGASSVQSLNLRPGRGLITRHRRVQFRSEEHTSELQSRSDLVCRLLLEKKKK